MFKLSYTNKMLICSYVVKRSRGNLGELESEAQRGHNRRLLPVHYRRAYRVKRAQYSSYLESTSIIRVT